MARRVNERTSVEASSGNVFADLGLPDASELDTKARLAVKINGLVAAQRLNQLTELSQPKISALRNYRLEGFSVEGLMNILLALGQDVE